MTIRHKDELETVIQIFKAGNKKSALKRALQLKKLSTHPDISNTIGIIYRSLKKRDLALKEYERALKAEPKNPTYLNNKANILRDVGLFDKAAETYKLALKFKVYYISYERFYKHWR